jgi:lipopolysaccharide export system protein LptA
VDTYKSKNIAKVYNNAYVAKITDDGDTLFITADTLVSIDDVDPAKKRVLAYRNVKIFKSDFQGIADSLEYRAADSTLYFYKDPVLWTNENQMTADSIRVLIEKKNISKIYLVSKAFVVSKDSLLNFNQIKGRTMTADFGNGQLKRVNVQGNGESLYFALDEKTHELTGMNKILCSNIIIRFLNGKVNKLSFYVKPDANFIPPHELTNEVTQLDGFIWKEPMRPIRKDVVKQTPVQDQPPVLKEEPTAPKRERPARKRLKS